MNLVVLNDQSVDAESKYQADKKAISDSLVEVQRLEEKSRDQQLSEEKIWFRDLMLGLSALALIIVAIGAYFLFKSNKLVKAKNRIVEEQHTEITDSIAYAQRIQTAMISNEDAWNKISPHRFIFFKPKDVVSGDFYWAHFDQENQLGIWAVADCTGHGVPGAFMSLLGTSFLNQIIIEGGERKPGEILDLLRKKVLNALSKKGEDQAKDGMDIGLCVWEKEKSILHYAGANNPLWIVRKRENYVEDSDSEASGRTVDSPEFNFVLLEVPPSKMPIGHFPGSIQPFRTRSIELCLGDTLLMATDGYADQFGGPNSKKLKSKPFKAFLVKIQAEVISDQLGLVESQFDAWRGEEEQIDDVCVIGVRVS
jgi:serine phosphatase RsbU (regulator of sigma subunit)